MVLAGQLNILAVYVENHLACKGGGGL